MTQMSALETASAIRTGQTSVIEVVENALLGLDVPPATKPDPA